MPPGILSQVSLQIMLEKRLMPADKSLPEQIDYVSGISNSWEMAKSKLHEMIYLQVKLMLKRSGQGYSLFYIYL